MDLVVSASTGALKAVLPELVKLVDSEYNLQTSVKDGIQHLHAELENMQVALEMVSKVPPDQLDPQVKLWASNMRVLSYSIQDTIDSYMVRVDESGSSTTCCINLKGIQPKTCKGRRDIAIDIKRITNKVEEMSRRHTSFKFDIKAIEPPPDPRLGVLYKDKENLVGIDISSKQITDKLYKEGDEGTSEQKLKLVSIVGPPGMGKTTLALAAYEQLRGKFDCTAFIPVSLQPDMKNILGEILREITRNIKDDREDKEKDMNKDKDKSLLRQKSQKHDENTQSWSHKEVIDKIRHILKNRRYLIVIDDLWNTKDWGPIEYALFENKLGSKVITTTRKIEVARSCCSSSKFDGIVHELKPLKNSDSEQLFYYQIFGKDGCPANLKSISHKILEKCKGWPLAIVTISSLLANKSTKSKDEWCSVYDSIISNGLGKDDDDVKAMRFILSLSYRDMRPELRACLLYLSIFSEDHVIGRDDLIRRWMAEDLVQGYESGDTCFNELINWSMIQPSDVDVLGKVQSCKMHDLVLDFVTSLSAEENFVTILNDQQDFPSQPDSIHRLSLRKEEHSIPQATKRLPHVRTLIVSSGAINSMPSLSIFPVLRVLELEHCTTGNIKSVGDCVHLRYLRLSQSYYDQFNGCCIELPKAIGRLRLLQTLDLKDATIKEWPSTVVRLIKLRVLEISLRNWDKRYEKHLLRCLGNLKQLEVLCIFAPDLSLDFMLEVDWISSDLQRFTVRTHDQSQHILRRGSVWAELSPFSTVPRWMNSVACSLLSDLSIMVEKLRQEDLDILAGLPKLLSLDLEVVQVEGEAIGRRLKINGPGRSTPFPFLGNFKFATRAAGLVFRSGAMQKLQNLYLCFDLAETKDVYGDFDFGLENLTSVKIVKVEIDCRCAMLSEVKAAEVALYDSTELNPNCPTPYLKRYFEREMLSDEEEEIPEEQRAKKKEDTQLSTVGPFGGNGGRSRDIRVAPHRLKNISIFSGDIVDSLAFSYTDHEGQQRSAGPWGSHNAVESKINLGPSDYLIKVSGTVGSHFGLDNLITSLTFVTNAASYGPFGKGGGHPFVFKVQRNSSIVGFFGRAGSYLDAIGFYVRPL